MGLAAFNRARREAAAREAAAVAPKPDIPTLADKLTEAGLLDHERLTKAQLLEIAHAAGVETTGAMTKAEIAAAIGPVRVETVPPAGDA